MRLFYFPVDLTGHLIMIEKLDLGEIWTGDLPIFNPDALITSIYNLCAIMTLYLMSYETSEKHVRSENFVCSRFMHYLTSE